MMSGWSPAEFSARTRAGSALSSARSRPFKRSARKLTSTSRTSFGCRNLTMRIASRNKMFSYSPTVPPISDDHDVAPSPSPPRDRSDRSLPAGCAARLHAFAAVFHVAFALDDRLIDTAGRHVIRAGKFLFKKSLVVAHILIALRPVIQNKNLPVLGGVHGARVDVNVRIDFERCDINPRACRIWPMDAA